MDFKDRGSQGKNLINLKLGAFFLLFPILILAVLIFYQDAKVHDAKIYDPKVYDSKLYDAKVHGDYNRLTPELLRKAYVQYSSYNESYMNLDQYLEGFPTQNYSLYKVKDFAYFYLENKKDVIKTLLRCGVRWEPNLINYMAQYVKKNSNVLDIGAHIGTHTIYLAQLLAGKGTVYAFEPQKKLFMELNANLFVNHVKNVKTFRYAVGEKKGVVEMNPAVKGNEGGTSVGHGGDKADRLSIDSLGLKNVSFIKIDVEGYENHVLDGAVKTIKANKPVILCEIMGGNPLETALPVVKEKILHTIAKFKALGYKVTRVSACDYLAVPMG